MPYRDVASGVRGEGRITIHHHRISLQYCANVYTRSSLSLRWRDDRLPPNNGAAPPVRIAYASTPYAVQETLS